MLYLTWKLVIKKAGQKKQNILSGFGELLGILNNIF